MEECPDKTFWSSMLLTIYDTICYMCLDIAQSPQKLPIDGQKICEFFDSEFYSKW